MSRWTDEELRELITLWPTHSVLQIAKRLRRPRSAIRGKAMLLCLYGLLHNPEHFDIKRPKRRRPQRPHRDLTDLPLLTGVTASRLGVRPPRDYAVTEEFAREACKVLWRSTGLPN
jgi:hypothetical protein